MLWIYHVSFISFCCTFLRVKAVQYSNRWSVQIYGDEEEVDRLARKHGFVNQGKVCENVQENSGCKLPLLVTRIKGLWWYSILRFLQATHLVRMKTYNSSWCSQNYN